MAKNKLYVKRTNVSELTEKWGFKPPINEPEIFIRCNKKGDVNWDKTPIYSIRELFDRGNVVLI